MSAKVVWVPIESNPEVMTKFVHQLGVPSSWQLCDVYGLDDDLLSTVPQPAVALLLLFPINQKYEQYRLKETAEVKQRGQKISDKVYYMKQTISNACGTIGLIHCLANNRNRIQLASGPLKEFLDETDKLDPIERGRKLESNSSITIAHEERAQEGQTEPSQIDVDYHFVAFVHVDGALYELDGRKEFPINHGPTTEQMFLKDAAKVCRQYIERDPDEVHFTIVALTVSE